jgi:hypothetical protein
MACLEIKIKMEGIRIIKQKFPKIRKWNTLIIAVHHKMIKNSI